MKQYLKYYINYNQDNWIKYISITQFVYNISIHETIKQILFFINYKFYSTIYKIPTIELDNLYTTIKTKYLKFLYDKFKNKLLFIKNQMVKYYNIKRMKKPSFEKKIKIYLLYKNITIKQPNNKLNFKKFKPFIII